jgi:hypothetical protein
MEQAKDLRKAIANAIGSKSKKDAKDPNQSSLEKSKASLKGALLGKKKAQRPLKVSSRFMRTFSAKTPDSAGTRLSSVKSEQPRGPTYRGTT